MENLSPPARLRPLAAALLVLAAAPAGAALTVNPDGTVDDSETGLMWDRCTWGRSGPDCTAGSTRNLTWLEALAAAAEANAAVHLGHTDWRVPNAKELDSIAALDRLMPAVDPAAFPSILGPMSLWSSTPVNGLPGYAATLRTFDGIASGALMSNRSVLLLVRGGDDYDLLRLSTGPGTLPEAVAGERYEIQLTPTGGYGEYTLALTAGTLPPGLAFDPETGILSGNPARAGTYTFTVSIDEAVSGAHGSTEHTLTVVAPAAVPLGAPWTLAGLGALLAGLARRRLARR